MARQVRYCLMLCYLNIIAGSCERIFHFKIRLSIWHRIRINQEFMNKVIRNIYNWEIRKEDLLVTPSLLNGFQCLDKSTCIHHHFSILKFFNYYYCFRQIAIMLWNFKGNAYYCVFFLDRWTLLIWFDVYYWFWGDLSICGELWVYY